LVGANYGTVTLWWV